jgi:hypothetical protein
MVKDAVRLASGEQSTTACWLAPESKNASRDAGVIGYEAQ